MALLEIKNLNFSYPKQHDLVLEGINLKIEQGEFIVVCGESGSGKSTLLRLLKRELAPHGNVTGDIYYQGKPVQEMADYESASKIGFVMQNPETQIVTDKVWSELAFGLENLGVAPQVIRSRVGEMANYFGIHEWFKQDTAGLSGGQKQILNLASVLVMQPDILILDEPTAQLDPIAAADFMKTLHQLNQEMNITIVIVEHRLEELYSLATKIVLLDKGHLVLEGTPRVVGKEMLKTLNNKKMLAGFPASLRLYYDLNIPDTPPLNVKEGISFLKKHYQGHVVAQQDSDSEGKLTAPVIAELSDIWFRYNRKGKDILTDVNLKVHQGEIFCLLGGNGSGKSTLLNVLSGIHKAYEGRVKLFGKRLASYKPSEIYGTKLAVLPQNPLALFIDETVEDDYKNLCQSVGYSKEDTKKKIEEIVSLLEIQSLLSRYPYDVSGGEQQKIALGKILLLDPEFILLDEPTKGIDAHAKNNFGDILKTLQAKGKTIFMVTHDTEFAAAYASRCALFFDQQVVSLNTPVGFFSSNYFYTTPANKIARDLYPSAITVDDIVNFCRIEERNNK